MQARLSRILLFGDDRGIPLLLKVVPPRVVCGIVGASIRPAQHARLEHLAREARVTFLVQPKADSSEYRHFADAVVRLAPEMMLVNSYSMRIRAELLEIARFGGVNIHGALLPQYRGCNPMQWALINEEEETGVTMHVITPEFDQGDIIAQKRVPILFEDTWLEIRDRVWHATEALLVEQVPRLLAQTHARIPQVESAAHYCRRRKPDDGEFRWEQSVISIYNLVRALVAPHPGAFFLSHGRKTVLNEYLTVPQLVEMKYSPLCGGQVLKSGRVCMTPLSVAAAAAAGSQSGFKSMGTLPVLTVTAADKEDVPDKPRCCDVLCFSFGDAGGSAGLGILLLYRIDHHGREARMAVAAARSVDGDCLVDVLRLSSAIAFDELRLERLLVPGVENEELFVKACGQAGLCPESRVPPGHGEGSASSFIALTRKGQEKPCQGKL